MSPAASTAASGWPQWGQAMALVETLPWHSEHIVMDIWLPLLTSRFTRSGQNAATRQHDLAHLDYRSKPYGRTTSTRRGRSLHDWVQRQHVAPTARTLSANIICYRVRPKWCPGDHALGFMADDRARRKRPLTPRGPKSRICWQRIGAPSAKVSQPPDGARYP